MFGKTKCILLATCMLAFGCTKHISPPEAEVIHWWTAGGESDAVRALSDAYKAAGGIWVDTAVSIGEQSRSVTINRIVGGNPPAAAQFNTSRQFIDLVEQNMLNNVDEVAIKDKWDQFLPETVLNAIKINGHYYAAPLDIHMPTWIWYSKAAFKKAGITEEPKSMDELFSVLDKLKAAGIIPLAHGGQGWQDNIVFTSVLANVGGKDLYLKVYRDHDNNAINSPAFKHVLTTYKRLHAYIDAGSPGRNWNDATTMLITGKAGVQIMGDWVKGEFNFAKQKAGEDFGCIAGFGADSPYIIQGDVLVFPKTEDAKAIKAQKLLASVTTSPTTQLEFNRRKGSIPIRADIDASQMDTCAQQGLNIMKDKARQLGSGEIYLTPDQNGALTDILTAYWNNNSTVEKAQLDIAYALTNQAR